MPQPDTNLLDAIPTEQSQYQVFRFANITDSVAALKRLGLDAQSNLEMRELLTCRLLAITGRAIPDPISTKAAQALGNTFFGRVVSGPLRLA